MVTFLADVGAHYTGYKSREFVFCDSDCPEAHSFSALLAENVYPSSPSKPGFAFDERILELFHTIYMRGSLSKQNYCYGLRLLLQRQKASKVCPRNRQSLTYADT